MTITGTNFGATQGTSTVTFNGTTATPTELECDEHRGAGAGRSDDGERGSDGGRSSEQRSELHGAGDADDQQPEPDVRSGGGIGDDHGYELRIDARDEHGDVQRDDGNDDSSWSATSIVVPVPAGATTGNVVVTVGGVASNGVSFTVLATPTITQPEPDVRSGGGIGDDHGYELRVDARDEHGDVQRDDGDDDKQLECDEHRGAGAGRSDDGERGGDGGRSSEQRSELHGAGDADDHEPEPDVRSGRGIGDDHGYELRATQGTSTVTFNGTSATTTAAGVRRASWCRCRQERRRGTWW